MYRASFQLLMLTLIIDLFFPTWLGLRLGVTSKCFSLSHNVKKISIFLFIFKIKKIPLICYSFETFKTECIFLSCISTHYFHVDLTPCNFKMSQQVVQGKKVHNRWANGCHPFPSLIHSVFPVLTLLSLAHIFTEIVDFSYLSTPFSYSF